MTRLALDRRARRLDGGRVLVAGTPPRVFALTERGRAVVDDLERAVVPGADAAGLVDRLLDAGAVHRVLAPHERMPADLVTVVIPTKDTIPRWRVGHCRTIVVDDASGTPVSVPRAETIRLERNIGPGRARNAGLDRVDTPFVAFVDSDVAITEDDLLHLAAHLDDDRIDMVAPRIIGDEGPDLRARYERRRGALDLGTEPSPVAPGARVAYLPAAVMVARTDALRAVGGFDTGMRVGEDVDLVWRLVRSGRRVRYDPAVIADHRPRASWQAWFAQRFGYGTAAAPLDRRFPGEVAPVRADAWQLAPWAALAVPGLGRWRPVVVAALAVATTTRLVRRLGAASTPLPPAEAVRLVGRGQTYLARALASAVVRVWWPITAVAAVSGRTGRRLVGVSLLVRFAETIAPGRSDPARSDPARVDPARVDLARLDPVRTVAVGLLDDIAYGAGVWRGAWRERRPSVLAVRLVRAGADQRARSASAARATR